MNLDRIVIVVWHDGKQDPGVQQYDLLFEGSGVVPRDELALYRQELEKALKHVLDRIEGGV
jgi:hypothetical protein